MNYSISAIVITYKAADDCLFRTLQSVIDQRDIDFDVVVADDGTPDFDVARVERWFEKHNFSNYKIVANPVNRGTVHNVLSSLLAAEGEYVRGVSPGDFLYDPLTLRKIYDRMKSENCKVLFGKVANYTYDRTTGSLSFISRTAPRDYSPYLRQNTAQIRRAYLLHRDYISGAAFAYHRTTWISYLSKIDGKIIYTEDSSVIMMVADGIIPSYFDQYVSWYEYGSGVSTSGSAVWAERLRKDNTVCFQMILEQHPEYRKYVVRGSNSRFRSCLYSAIVFMRLVYVRLREELRGEVNQTELDTPILFRYLNGTEEESHENS